MNEAYPHPLPSMPVDYNEDGKVLILLYGYRSLDGQNMTWLTVNDARKLAGDILAHCAEAQSCQVTHLPSPLPNPLPPPIHSDKSGQGHDMKIPRNLPVGTVFILRNGARRTISEGIYEMRPCGIDITPEIRAQILGDVAQRLEACEQRGDMLVDRIAGVEKRQSAMDDECLGDFEKRIGALECDHRRKLTRPL